jgi:hypothetical protein
MAAVDGDPLVDSAPAKPPASRWLPAARLVPWLFLLLIVLPAILLGTSFLRINVKAAPGGVPADMCALIPADLLAQVVPAGKVSGVESKNSESYTNVARCEVQTEPDKATTTANASLAVELRRNGSLAGRNPRQHAQDDFASGKKLAMTDTITPTRVFEVSRLGDSAYVSVRKPSSLAATQHQSMVEVQALAGDKVLRITYFASPTTDDLAASAAVAVVRALLSRVP